ncbi:hypothetical protein ACJIZ3_021788 [Penstemon smallii]|uniref:Glutaredoxin domain-containing protein n=1 Tax=Penstemon smallii TaxID=265156 RepID=A0ABD3SMF0_9LAMI
MGCISSKLIKREIQRETLDYANHVVSLTSTTYGALKLDKSEENQAKQSIKECAAISAAVAAVEFKKSSPPRDEPSEIINAWELMEGLEDEMPISVQSKKSPKSKLFIERSPFKFLNQMGSPKKAKKFVGKENKGRIINGGNGSLENSPKTAILKECNNNLKESVKKPSPRLWASIKGSPNGGKRCDSLRIDSGVVLSRRRNLGPIFDPVLVASLEKEVSEEEEIKKMVSVSISSTPKSRYSSYNSDAILELYDKKCPPGGENSVVVYTTTLRGIRKTFEDCNIVRSIIESRDVRVFERDISMHSGYKEELRVLMGSKEVKVPLVFVKGRLIGGADEMVRLDEEGKLGILLDGIPVAEGGGCGGCGGIRFVMCRQCNGSCKVLGEDGKKSLKCSECNENGLIQCPICC